MKKALLIISILSIIFLAGCGTFDLDGWVCPDDIDFIATIDKLKTPQDISTYMVENFTYEIHDFYAPDPYTLWKTKKGDCNDFATFGIFIADYHGYETYLIKIFYKGAFEKHVIAVYVEGDGLSFTDNRLYFNNDGFYFNLFKEVVDWDSDNITFLDWRKYIVYDYWDNKVEVRYND